MSSQQDAQTNESKEKKPDHYLAGIGVCATLMWSGAILLFVAPGYWNIHAPLAYVPAGLGIISIIIGIVGALYEMEKVWKSEAFNYFAAAAIFLVPAVVTVFAISRFPGIIESIGKFFVILLLIVGGSLLIYGIPYLFPDVRKDHDSAPTEIREQPKKWVDPQTKISFITALLALVATIIKIGIDFRV